MHKKGYIRNIINFSSIDGPGNRTAIFFQGCNFNCINCHNPETIKIYNNLYNNEEVKLLSVQDILEILDQNKPYIQGVTISGGECSVQFDFLFHLVKTLKKEGFEVYVDTNGSLEISKFQKLLSIVDKFIFDLKVFNLKDHKRITGKSNIKIKRNIKIAGINKKIYEIRTVVIPKEIDNINNVYLISKFISSIDESIRYKLIKYRDHGVRKDMIDSYTPQKKLMDKLEKICRKNGLKNIIIK
ncbi:MAG: 4Fe-4S cluster-binding domain-containing protein [Bacillota bacterium]